jgi:protein-disulfide isomerase
MRLRSAWMRLFSWIVSIRGKYADAVNADRGDGETLGVRGTPTFFFGTVDPDNRGRVHALRTIMGNLPLRDFQKAIEETLAESNRNAEPRP